MPLPRLWFDSRESGSLSPLATPFVSWSPFRLGWSVFKPFSFEKRELLGGQWETLTKRGPKQREAIGSRKWKRVSRRGQRLNQTPTRFLVLNPSSWQFKPSKEDSLLHLKGEKEVGETSWSEPNQSMPTWVAPIWTPIHTTRSIHFCIDSDRDPHLIADSIGSRQAQDKWRSKQEEAK